MQIKNYIYSSVMLSWFIHAGIAQETKLKQPDPPIIGDASRVGILPEGRKKGIRISEDSIIPFGIPAQKTQKTQSKREENTQEDQIRDIFSRLRVTGAVKTEHGQKRLLLDNIILEKGKIIDQLLPGQTDSLMVTEITEKEVEISWMEKSPTNRQARTLTVPIDLDPKVRFALKGQIDGQKKQHGIHRPNSEQSSNSQNAIIDLVSKNVLDRR